ncbi:ATP-binding protein [Paenibacillus xerothermodurans]|uniref:histidine kinase n=1 Tax=Paenibacillus xerothermodurans TaxID=1977292 RepID=A0A2W1P247_PAEXE|nr:ATP-binding protein [Paenibacillus xerothermodurans]PZE21812.1 PAS domain S-box protein [Paenibacillus xerothermodurans]
MLNNFSDQELVDVYTKCLLENLSDDFKAILEKELKKRKLFVTVEQELISLAFGKSNLDFYQLVKYSLDSCFVLQDDKVIYINQAGFDLLGLKYPEQVIGEAFSRFLHPDFHGIHKKRLETALNGEVTELMEQRMLKSDGETIDVEVMAAPYAMDGQNLAQIIVRNITQRKQTERRLHNLEKLSSIGQMAAGIAHEVRNPLTAVKGFVQLLEKELVHPYLPIVVEELDNAIKTLNNLLQVAKPDLNNEPDVMINLCSELESLIFLFQEQLYKVTVNKHFQNCDKEFRGKKNLILKAFFNLLKNAIEAIDGKGEITLEHFYRNNMIHIKVRDTGSGVPAAKIKLLGTPFFTTKEDGVGMGLTQVFTTIHEHGGHIHVESEEGKGTEFHIQLPAPV